MKKALIVISSLVVIAAVFTTSSFAHGGGHGRKHSRHAKVWKATLLAPGATAPTGQTGATGDEALNRRRGKSGNYGGSVEPTGPAGKALYAQNRKRYVLGVRVKKLTPATVYNVAIYTNADGKGCASTTNAALNPPAITAITTNADGNGQTQAKGSRADVSLDKTKAYYVSVTDGSGAVVLCGDLVTKAKRGHHGHGSGGKGNCGNHGATGETGGTGATSIDPTSRRRH